MRIVAALTAAAPTVIRTVQDGFDWGAAAAGAGVAIAVVLLAAALASLVRRSTTTHGGES